MQPTVKENMGEKSPGLYRLIYRIIWLVSPKYTLQGMEKLPDEPCVFVGNHSQMYGPIAAELYLPRPHYIWCIGEMTSRKEVPDYAFREFWSMKPKALRWFYRLLSYAIAPLADYIFSHAHTIPVRRDARIMTTFRKSIDGLNSGADVVIFPEKHEPYNGILSQFEEHFADLAKLYYRKTGKSVCFVPLYTAPGLKSLHFGDPVRYRPEAPEDEERIRICSSMMASITALAKALPEHTVVPYENIPKRRYPRNTDCRQDGKDNP